jgi:hypothetical protein
MPTDDEGSESEEIPNEEEIFEDVERAVAAPLKISKLKHRNHPRVIMAAARVNERVLENVIPRFLTEDMLRTLIDENWVCLKFIPPVSKTEELCLIALQKSDGALSFIPNKFKRTNPRFYEIAIDHNAANLAKVLEEDVTPDLVRRALEKNPNVIYVEGVKELILKHLPDYEEAPIPAPIKRQLSATHTNQGDEGVCGRHAFSRVILRNVFELMLPLAYSTDYQDNECNDILNTFTAKLKPRSIHSLFYRLQPDHCTFGGYVKILVFLHLFHLFQTHVPTIPDRPVGWLECSQVSTIYPHLYDSVVIPHINPEQRSDLMDALDTVKRLTVKHHISLITFHFKTITMANIKKFTDQGLYLMLRIEDSRYDEEGLHKGHFLIIVAAFDNYLLIKNSWDADTIYKIEFNHSFYLDVYEYDTMTDCSVVIPVEHGGNEEFDNLDRVDEFLEKYVALKRKFENITVLLTQKCPSQSLEPVPCKNDSDYRRQALIFHPDKNSYCRENATEKFKRLNEICRPSQSTQRLGIGALRKTKRRYPKKSVKRLVKGRSRRTK